MYKPLEFISIRTIGSRDMYEENRTSCLEDMGEGKFKVTGVLTHGSIITLDKKNAEKLIEALKAI